LGKDAQRRTKGFWRLPKSVETAPAEILARAEIFNDAGAREGMHERVQDLKDLLNKLFDDIRTVRVEREEVVPLEEDERIGS
jgi:hypothetical protein